MKMKIPKPHIKTSFWEGNKEDMEERTEKLIYYFIATQVISIIISLARQSTWETILHLIIVGTLAIMIISHNNYKKKRGK